MHFYEIECILTPNYNPSFYAQVYGEEKIYSQSLVDAPYITVKANEEENKHKRLN